MMYGHWGWGIMWLGWLFWLAVIIAIIWLVVRVSGMSRNGRGGGLPGETALDILKKRYAKGEITKEDYDRMRRDIET